MAQTVSFAITGALILSVTYIPMMSALFLKREASHHKNISDRVISFLQGIYTPLLNKALQFKRGVLTASILVFAISLYLFSRMGGEFIPTLQEGDFAFHCILPQGTSISQSLETSMQASRLIKEFDEVQMVVGKTGSAEVPTDPMPPEVTDLIIILKPVKEWTRKISYAELGDEIMEKLEVIPGVFFEKSQPIQMRFNELMTGVRQDVAVKIFGENVDTLLAYANKITPLIQTIKGVTAPSIERVIGLPQLVINYNRSQLANYDLTIEQVNHIVSTAFAGGQAGVVYENERRFALVVRLDSSFRSEIEEIGQLYIPAKNGTQIPLSQVADISISTGPAQISREDGKRRIVIGFNVEDRDVESVVEEIEEQFNERIRLPDGYYYTFGGTFENFREASQRLLIAVPVALLLIFILLFFTFHSVKQAVLIYTAIPMSAIGGIFALLFRDMPFSISAGIGFIALFGVAVLNGIVLIGTFNQLEKNGMKNIIQRIREGTSLRLRPVLMTATVASLGFLPMALAHGPGAEVQKPLATVVIGGLISATFLTLFVLPVLYLLISEKSAIKFSSVKLIPLLLCSLGEANAQKVLTANEAVNLSLRNNLSLQSQWLNIQSSEHLKRSVFELPKSELGLQYGQYSSIHYDLGFQVNQSIPFPGYYSAKSKLLRAESQEAHLQLQLTANEVKARVLSEFSKLQFLQLAISRLNRLDSLYNGLAEAASLRLATGESSLLEKTTADAKRGQITLLLKQYETEYAVSCNSLKALLNMDEDFIIDTTHALHPLTLEIEIDTSLISDNPKLQLQYQYAVIAGINQKVERNTALPDFTLGYFNQSLTGPQTVNGEEIFFTRDKRFTGVNAGISIPLTFFSNSSKIKSLRFKQQSLEKEAENSRLSLQTQLWNAFQQYEFSQYQFNYYKNTAVPNVEIIIRTANSGFRNGEIGYIEYLKALETATEIQLGYLSTVHQLNQSIITINNLICK